MERTQHKSYGTRWKVILCIFYVSEFLILITKYLEIGSIPLKSLKIGFEPPSLSASDPII